jgi:hypothetical protein
MFHCQTYNTQTFSEFNNAKAPVILLSKTRHLGGYSVELLDSNKKLYHMGSISGLAVYLGEAYSEGDTVKK